MSLTAFLPTGAPQVLPFIGTPGAATVGYALVWSESPQGFSLAPIAVGPDQFSGVLPISKGGTGITSFGTGVATALGQNVTGSGGGLVLATGATAEFNTISSVREGSATIFETFSFSNTIFHFPQFLAKRARGTRDSPAPCIFNDQLLFVGSQSRGKNGYSETGTGFYVYADQDSINASTNDFACRIVLAGVGPSALYGEWVQFRETGVNIQATTASTSTTTGAARIGGGLGVGGAIYNGGNLVSSGNKINFENLPTSNSGLAVGDLWRDGELVKVKV